MKMSWVNYQLKDSAKIFNKTPPILSNRRLLSANDVFAKNFKESCIQLSIKWYKTQSLSPYLSIISHSIFPFSIYGFCLLIIPISDSGYRFSPDPDIHQILTTDGPKAIILDPINVSFIHAGIDKECKRYISFLLWF